MKILLAITSLGVGGAERLVTGLADRFVAEGHEVVLVSFQGAPEVQPRNPDVRLVDLQMRRSPLGVLFAMWRFRKLVLEFAPDVVNSHLVHANILTRVLRLFTRMARLVSSAHNTNEEGRMRIVAYRLTDRLADISTNVSYEAVEAFVKQGAVRPGRMVALYNGIDTEIFGFDAQGRVSVREELGMDESTPLLLAVGRLFEQKDYPNLLQAFSEVEFRSAAPHIVIAGDGPLRGKLQALADSLGVADRVAFLGVRYDVVALMSACDVFVLSSAWEGFGLVVAEAMACQRPVVATDCGGVSEVVGSVGFLAPPRDSKGLRNELQRALALSSSERDRLGREGRVRVEAMYSLDAAVERWVSLYRGEGRQ